jgi:predicted DCC family thiol-disulfide oxidoreductase YuxK
VSALPNQDPGVVQRHGLSRADVDRWVWAIELGGRRWHGAGAVARTLGEMGGGWRLLGMAFRLPGAGLAYSLVARNRSRLSALWGDPPPY